MDSTSTPIYEADATYAVGTGPLELSSGDAMVLGDAELQDQELLATMQTLKNPLFWEDMMMPG
jgi:hypothetical protein